MKRRKFIKAGAILLPALSVNAKLLLASYKKTFKRVRPSDALWPAEDKWQQLNKAVNGNLIKIDSPFPACKSSNNIQSCDELFKGLKNPYFIGDNPALTQSTGWLNAWQS